MRVRNHYSTGELQLDTIPRLRVFNKMDLVDPRELAPRYEKPAYESYFAIPSSYPLTRRQRLNIDSSRSISAASGNYTGLRLHIPEDAPGQYRER